MQVAAGMQCHGVAVGGQEVCGGIAQHIDCVKLHRGGPACGEALALRAEHRVMFQADNLPLVGHREQAAEVPLAGAPFQHRVFLPRRHPRCKRRNLLPFTPGYPGVEARWNIQTTTWQQGQRHEL